MKAMTKKPVVKKPAKKYAMGGGVPNTGMQAPPVDMAAKQQQLPMPAQRRQMAAPAPTARMMAKGGSVKGNKK